MNHINIDEIRLEEYPPKKIINNLQQHSVSLNRSILSMVLLYVQMYMYHWRRKASIETCAQLFVHIHAVQKKFNPQHIDM